MSTYEDELTRYKRMYEEEVEIVNHCWSALNINTYTEARGLSIYEHIAGVVKDAARYRWLKENYDLAVGENPASMPIDDDLIDAAILDGEAAGSEGK